MPDLSLSSLERSATKAGVTPEFWLESDTSFLIPLTRQQIEWAEVPGLRR
jgi:hypothetical protein